MLEGSPTFVSVIVFTSLAPTGSGLIIQVKLNGTYKIKTGKSHWLPYAANQVNYHEETQGNLTFQRPHRTARLQASSGVDVRIATHAIGFHWLLLLIFLCHPR